jgi:serine/tyrosine/threonine adenylyltransferase
MPAGWKFDNTYARLPETLFEPARPVPVHAPRMVVFNAPLAESLGLDPGVLSGDAAVFAGNTLPPGSGPIAQAYAGHQFGHLSMLGDGRAILLGEHLSPDGRRWDIQLKGSGPTPFSRRGDGRAVLGPMLREYVVGEAMAAMGIPTTRALAVVATGETVLRERGLPGAVLTRVAASHIRVGTFEYAARTGDPETLRALASHTLRRHFPHLADDRENPFPAMLEEAIARQAALLARWMLVGFVHGVMNTDNMALSGETIDYGPCAFLDACDPAAVFSSIDQNGRYAFANQPPIAQWNLARLAESLLPLLDPNPQSATETANHSLSAFPGLFQKHWIHGMRSKLGLESEEDTDPQLANDLLELMHRSRADFTNTFLELSSDTPATLKRLTGFTPWLDRWRQRLARQNLPATRVQTTMRASNPAVIPRNHLLEDSLAAAEEGDMHDILRLLEALEKPFDHGVPREKFQSPPPPGRPPTRTFCGT